MSRSRPRIPAVLAALALIAAAPVLDAGTTRAQAGAPAALEVLDTPTSPALDAFYAPHAPLPDVAPGAVLRSRPVTIRGLGLPVPVLAWQVLYRSTDAQGRPNAVSGTAMVALDGRPLTGRPLVAYDIGTHGLGPECAPSYLLRQGLEQESGLMAGALARGFAVMVSDYEGLGTPGPHTYTSGLATGRAVLDGLRAARAVPELGLNTKSPVAIWGYSEGGLASTWAAELAPRYAPELNLVGVAAGGVPVDLATIGAKIDGGPLSGFLLAAAVGLDRAYPSMRLGALLNDRGRAATAAIASMCVAEFASTYANTPIAAYATVPDPLRVPRIAKILAANTLGTRVPAAPMFIYESVHDEFIPVEDVRGLVSTYCRAGLPVVYVEDAFSEHISLAAQGAPGALDWLSGRFAGTTVPSTC